MNCLIAGASGLVGGELLQLLLRDGRVDTVTSVGRRAMSVRAPKLEQVQADLAALGDLPPADVAFCALGTTIKKAGSKEAFYQVDHDYILNFAVAAELAGVKRFLLVSALGADADSRIFYNRVKGETERDVAQVGFESLHIFRPSLLLGQRKESRLAERLFVELYPLYRPLLLGPLAKSRPIQASQVAKAMVAKAFAPTIKSEVILNHQML